MIVRVEKNVKMHRKEHFSYTRRNRQPVEGQHLEAGHMTIHENTCSDSVALLMSALEPWQWVSKHGVHHPDLGQDHYPTN